MYVREQIGLQASSPTSRAVTGLKVTETLYKYLILVRKRNAHWA